MNILRLNCLFDESLLDNIETLTKQVDLDLVKYSSSSDKIELTIDSKTTSPDGILKSVEKLVRKAGLKSLLLSDVKFDVVSEDGSILLSKIVSNSFDSLNKEKVKTLTKALFKVLIASAPLLITACGSDERSSTKGSDVSGRYDINHDIPLDRSNPLLEGYIAEFVIEAENRGIDVTLNLEELRVARFVNEIVDEKTGNRGVLGQCTTGSITAGKNNVSLGGYRKITILEPEIRFAEYNKAPFANEQDKEYSLKTTIYHELGHCLLDLEHAEQYPDFSGRKKANKKGDINIMATYSPKVSNISDDEWSNAVDDLFELKRTKDGK